MPIVRTAALVPCPTPRSRRRARQETAVDARHTLLAGDDTPVGGIHEAAVVLVAPAEDVGVERLRALAVVGLDLEVDRT
jgi:hypothetical protein